MGIVNLVGDSFSGDGIVTISEAVTHARSLVAAGADIIDIGAESARTNRPAISEEAESAQLRKFIEQMGLIRSPSPSIHGAPVWPAPHSPPAERFSTISAVCPTDERRDLRRDWRGARHHAHRRRAESAAHPR